MGTNQPEWRWAGAAKNMGILKLKSKFTGGVRGENAAFGCWMSSSTGGIGLNFNSRELSSEVWDLPCVLSSALWSCWSWAAQPLIYSCSEQFPRSEERVFKLSLP